MSCNTSILGFLRCVESISDSIFSNQGQVQGQMLNIILNVIFICMNRYSYLLFSYATERTIINHICSNVHNLHKSNMAEKIPMLLCFNYSKLSRVLCN